MLNKLMKLKNKKGFTLVELIVVIAIIAILTAIIVPLVGRYSAQATYTTLQDAAQTISNNTNTVISDVTMMGTVYSSTPITGKKTGGNLTVEVNGKSNSTGTEPTTGSTIDDKVAAKLYNALQNALPDNSFFRVELSTNTVKGVIYCTGTDKVTSVAIATAGGGTGVGPVTGFETAYELTADHTPVGVSGAYKPVTTSSTPSAS